MSINSRLARLEALAAADHPQDVISAELAKFNAYVKDSEQRRLEVIAKLDAVLAGDETLQTFPDTPEKAFILERINRIAEARL